ncbi:DUF4956 domain-containing protein [Planktomarina temperata]|nr:DUF4956 domain-containing protein [Planktomarina temperata]
MQYIILHLDKILPILLLFITSVMLRLLLQVMGQRWIVTTAHTATIVMLPIITYTITKVIAGDIALSLGMVGALSIVRFRNPVRSPLELSVYFGVITMGIAASVNVMWVIFLAGSAALAALSLMLIHFISIRIFKTPFFYTSFTEGNALSTLNITCTARVELLENNKLLTYKRKDDGNVQYVMSAGNFIALTDIVSKIDSDERILNYELAR